MIQARRGRFEQRNDMRDGTRKGGWKVWLWWNGRSTHLTAGWAVARKPLTKDSLQTSLRQVCFGHVSEFWDNRSGWELPEPT